MKFIFSIITTFFIIFTVQCQIFKDSIFDTKLTIETNNIIFYEEFFKKDILNVINQNFKPLIYKNDTFYVYSGTYEYSNIKIQYFYNLNLFDELIGSLNFFKINSNKLKKIKIKNDVSSYSKNSSIEFIDLDSFIALISPLNDSIYLFKSNQLQPFAILFQTEKENLIKFVQSGNRIGIGKNTNESVNFSYNNQKLINIADQMDNITFYNKKAIEIPDALNNDLLKKLNYFKLEKKDIKNYLFSNYTILYDSSILKFEELDKINNTYIGDAFCLTINKKNKEFKIYKFNSIKDYKKAFKEVKFSKAIKIKINDLYQLDSFVFPLRCQNLVVIENNKSNIFYLQYLSNTKSRKNYALIPKSDYNLKYLKLAKMAINNDPEERDYNNPFVIDTIIDNELACKLFRYTSNNSLILNNLKDSAIFKQEDYFDYFFIDSFYISTINNKIKELITKNPNKIKLKKEYIKELNLNENYVVYKLTKNGFVLYDFYYKNYICNNFYNQQLILYLNNQRQETIINQKLDKLYQDSIQSELKYKKKIYWSEYDNNAYLFVNKRMINKRTYWQHVLADTLNKIPVFDTFLFKRKMKNKIESFELHAIHSLKYGWINIKKNNEKFEENKKYLIKISLNKHYSSFMSLSFIEYKNNKLNEYSLFSDGNEVVILDGNKIETEVLNNGAKLTKTQNEYLINDKLFDGCIIHLYKTKSLINEDIDSSNINCNIKKWLDSITNKNSLKYYLITNKYNDNLNSKSNISYNSLLSFPFISIFYFKDSNYYVQKYNIYRDLIEENKRINDTFIKINYQYDLNKHSVINLSFLKNYYTSNEILIDSFNKLKKLVKITVNKDYNDSEKEYQLNQIYNTNQLIAENSILSKKNNKENSIFSALNLHNGQFDTAFLMIKINNKNLIDFYGSYHNVNIDNYYYNFLNNNKNVLIKNCFNQFDSFNTTIILNNWGDTLIKRISKSKIMADTQLLKQINTNDIYSDLFYKMSMNINQLINLINQQITFNNEYYYSKNKPFIKFKNDNLIEYRLLWIKYLNDKLYCEWLKTDTCKLCDSFNQFIGNSKKIVKVNSIKHYYKTHYANGKLMGITKAIPNFFYHYSNNGIVEDCKDSSSYFRMSLYFDSFYNEKGDLIFDGKNGTVLLNDSKGVPIYEAHYKNGLLDSIYKAYNISGQLENIGFFKNGKKEGIWYSGNLESKYNWVQMCGATEEFIQKFLKENPYMKLIIITYKNDELIYKNEIKFNTER